MTPHVDVAVTDHSRLELFPLRLKRDGSGFVVGRPATGSYVALSAPALAATRLLSGGHTIGQAKEALAQEHADPEIRLRPLVETLLAAGLVKAVDRTPLLEPLPPRRYHLTSLRRRHVAWVFSRPAALSYATLVAAAVTILVAQPRRYLPRPADLTVVSNPALSVGLLWGVSLIALAAHEMAHLVAATFLGVRASFSLGNRLFFPVLQTDLTDLWLVDRRRRYLAYAAGMANDVLLACATVIGSWLSDQHLLPVPGVAYRTLRLTTLVLAVGVLWQFNFYLRTDVYYLIANFTGCRNLAGDATAYLRAKLKHLFTGEVQEPLAGVLRRERSLVRAFAALMVVGTAGVTLLGAACLGGLLRLLPGQGEAPHRALALSSQSPWPALAALGTTGVWLAAAVLARRRRRPRVHYRLRAPEDL